MGTVGDVSDVSRIFAYTNMAAAVEEGALSLHGLWTDIGEGGLQCYDPVEKKFVVV